MLSQIVFQDVDGVLTPRRTVGAQLREVLGTHHVVPASQADERVSEFLNDVGLSRPARDRPRRRIATGGEAWRIYRASPLFRAVPAEYEERALVGADDEEFVEFAAAAGGRLQRTAFMLCGDWHTAEDLAQTALAKVYVSWRKINRRGAAHAYASRTLVNTYLADRRTKRAGDLVTSDPPELASAAAAPDVRIVVLQALATLPPRARAVIVLRYYEDLSVGQAAEMLGCSTGNVKSQTARALDKLRPLLGELAPGGLAPVPGPARNTLMIKNEKETSA